MRAACMSELNILCTCVLICTTLGAPTERDDLHHQHSPDSFNFHSDIDSIHHSVELDHSTGHPLDHGHANNGVSTTNQHSSHISVSHPSNRQEDCNIACGSICGGIGVWSTDKAVCECSINPDNVVLCAAKIAQVGQKTGWVVKLEISPEIWTVEQPVSEPHLSTGGYRAEDPERPARCVAGARLATNTAPFRLNRPLIRRPKLGTLASPTPEKTPIDPLMFAVPTINIPPITFGETLNPAPHALPATIPQIPFDGPRIPVLPALPIPSNLTPVVSPILGASGGGSDDDSSDDSDDSSDSSDDSDDSSDSTDDSDDSSDSTDDSDDISDNSDNSDSRDNSDSSDNSVSSDNSDDSSNESEDRVEATLGGDGDSTADDTDDSDDGSGNNIDVDIDIDVDGDENDENDENGANVDVNVDTGSDDDDIEDDEEDDDDDDDDEDDDD